MQPVTYVEARRVLVWTVVVAHLLMLAALFFSNGLKLDLAQAGYVYMLVAIPAALVLYVNWRKMHHLQAVSETLLSALVMTVPLAVLSYAAMRLDMPLADARLIAMDDALGFDWRAFIGFVDARPHLANFLALSYSSFFYQLLLLPAWFCLHGKEARAGAIVFAFAATCMTLSVISIWFPAVGTYVAYGVRPDGLASINAHYGFFFLDQFNAVRNQPEFVLRMKDTAGLLTFPSGHAAVAGLCAWAAWDSRILRYPFLLLNIGMSVSAISNANHYLVDIIAGFGVAGLAISVASALFYRPSPKQSALMATAARFRESYLFRNRVTQPASPFSTSD